jgi:hypothetical protein
MLNQNNLKFNRLVSLNSNISYIVTVNLLGDISQHYRDTTLENIDIDKIAGKFRKITTAASLLNFDNVRFLMYEENNLNHVIINIQEISIIIGFGTNTTISDVLYVVDEFMKEHRLHAGSKLRNKI